MKCWIHICCLPFTLFVKLYHNVLQAKLEMIIYRFVSPFKRCNSISSLLSHPSLTEMFKGQLNELLKRSHVTAVLICILGSTLNKESSLRYWWSLLELCMVRQPPLSLILYSAVSLGGQKRLMIRACWIYLRL